MRTTVAVALSLSLLSISACSGAGQRSKSREIPQRDTEMQGGDVELLALRSSPAGASAKLSTGESCTTPCSVKKKKGSVFSVTFSKEGYASRTVPVSNNLEALRKFNRAKGRSVEDLTVTNLKLTPNPVSVNLEPEWSK